MSSFDDILSDERYRKAILDSTKVEKFRHLVPQLERFKEALHEERKSAIENREKLERDINLRKKRYDELEKQLSSQLEVAQSSFRAVRQDHLQMETILNDERQQWASKQHDYEEKIATSAKFFAVALDNKQNTVDERNKEIDSLNRRVKSQQADFAKLEQYSAEEHAKLMDLQEKQEEAGR